MFTYYKVEKRVQERIQVEADRLMSHMVAQVLAVSLGGVVAEVRLKGVPEWAQERQILERLAEIQPKRGS